MKKETNKIQMKNKDKIIKTLKNLNVRKTRIFSIVILIFGISTIVVSALINPFNDWSFNTNSELFSQYGDFIGGFIGTLFSLIAIILLYKTLISQRDAITKQDEAINNQKKAFEIERFETTFFNLLKTQRDITENIKAYFYSLKNDNDIKKNTYTAHGRDFFIYSINELTKIWKIIESNKYLGVFSEDIELIRNDIDEKFYDQNSVNYTNPFDVENEVEEYIHIENLKLATKQYRISSTDWEQMHGKETINKLEKIYELFFQRYHYAIGHYFRHLYHILKFVVHFEKSNNNFEGLGRKYINFVQAQMSSYEMALLFYNAISFPKLLRVLVDYNFFGNLAIEDLIDDSHNCIKGIDLIKRKKLLGNN